MSKIYTEILDSKRLAVFQKLDQVEDSAFLIGGTALALQIKHRKSIDFDLALDKPIKNFLLRKVSDVFSGHKLSVSVDQPNELTVILDQEVKVTFLHYPFSNLHPFTKTQYLNLSSLPDLASTKIQTIGRRGEWKDYVDVYFLLKKVGLNINQIIKESSERFGGEFNEKLFWEQLVYWDDILDFEIEYIGEEVPKEEIQLFFKREVEKRF